MCGVSFPFSCFFGRVLFIVAPSLSVNGPFGFVPSSQGDYGRCGWRNFSEGANTPLYAEPGRADYETYDPPRAVDVRRKRTSVPSTTGCSLATYLGNGCPFNSSWPDSLGSSTTSFEAFYVIYAKRVSKRDSPLLDYVGTKSVSGSLVS